MSDLTTPGELLRAEAVSDGLPPKVALAAQISTRKFKNVFAFRGSGRIPFGLYHIMFTGEGRPKPVTEKAKSSNIGPQAGRAVQDPRNGRYDLVGAEYKLRDDPPPKGLEAVSLEISLRNIYNDIGSKYELVGDENPDSHGVLRFRQIDHPSDQVKSIVYSVNVNQAKPIPKEISDNYHLVSDHLNQVTPEIEKGSPFVGLNLDSLCVVYAQHHPDEKEQEIKVLGGIVRDCDIDFITDPSSESLQTLFGNRDFKPYLEPVDMSAHGSEDKLRAQEAVLTMVERLLDLNQFRWEQYDALINQAKQEQGADFNESAYADEKPFVDRDVNHKLMSAMVVTVGKGSPMQLYQALEINVIQQKILASSTAEEKEKRVNIKDLDSTDPEIRNAALLKLHEQEIIYSEQTIARAFIQHPGECHNEHYTSPRGTSVAVSGDKIILGNDADMSNFIRGQYIPINPKWIAENSPGNKNAAVWVRYFLEYSETLYHDKADVKKEVDKFLEKNTGFIKDMLAHNSNPQLQGYLSNFLQQHPQIKNQLNNDFSHSLDKEIGIERTEIKLEDFKRDILQNIQKTLNDKYTNVIYDNNGTFTIQHSETEQSQFIVEKNGIYANQPTLETLKAMFISFISSNPDKIPEVTLDYRKGDVENYQDVVKQAYAQACEKMKISANQELQFSAPNKQVQESEQKTEELNIRLMPGR